MRRLWLLLSLVAIFFVAPLRRARAAETDPSDDYAAARTGFQLGVRFSAQVPSGGLGGGASLSDVLGPRAHLAFDIGSKLNPYFFLGGYAGFSYGLQGNAFTAACGATDAYGNSPSCTAESVDGGIVAIVTFMPSDLVDPWVGLSLGYELQGFDYAGASGTFSGISPTVLAGADLRFRDRDHRGVASLGPYLGLTGQKYFTANAGGSSLDAGAEPIHAWIHFGLRLTFPS
jgi:hypothetical protein